MLVHRHNSWIPVRPGLIRCSFCHQPPHANVYRCTICMVEICYRCLQHQSHNFILPAAPLHLSTSQPRRIQQRPTSTINSQARSSRLQQPHGLQSLIPPQRWRADISHPVPWTTVRMHAIEGRMRETSETLAAAAVLLSLKNGSPQVPIRTTASPAHRADEASHSSPIPNACSTTERRHQASNLTMRPGQQQLSRQSFYPSPTTTPVQQPSCPTLHPGSTPDFPIRIATPMSSESDRTLVDSAEGVARLPRSAFSSQGIGGPARNMIIGQSTNAKVLDVESRKDGQLAVERSMHEAQSSGRNGRVWEL